MSKHTPGPWAIGRDDRPGMEWNNHIIRRDNPNITVCFMAHSGKDDNSESEADARLIAAAPELLEALKALLFNCEETARILGYSTKQIVEGPAFKPARAAIAKAEGDQQ